MVKNFAILDVTAENVCTPVSPKSHFRSGSRVQRVEASLLGGLCAKTPRIPLGTFTPIESPLLFASTRL